MSSVFFLDQSIHLYICIRLFIHTCMSVGRNLFVYCFGGYAIVEIGFG